MKNIYLLIGFMFVVLMTGCGKAQTEVVFLRVEMQENPDGVAATQPRFSWQIRSVLSDVVQQSYQIQVASSEMISEGAKSFVDSGMTKATCQYSSHMSERICYHANSYFWRVEGDHQQGGDRLERNQYWSMAIPEQC